MLEIQTPAGKSLTLQHGDVYTENEEKGEENKDEEGKEDKKEGEGEAAEGQSDFVWLEAPSCQQV